MRYNREVYIDGGYYLEFENDNCEFFYFSFEKETETHTCDGDRWETTSIYLGDSLYEIDNEKEIREVCQGLI